MKTIKTISVLAISILIWISAAGQVLKDLPKSETFAVEINGVLCGYAESEITTIQKDGQEFLLLKRNILAKLSVLGGGVDLTVKNEFLINPETDIPVSAEHVVTTTAEIYAFTKFESGNAFFTNVRGGELRKIELNNNVIIENSVSYPHLLKDFIKGTENEKSYRVFDDIKGVVATKSYKLLGNENLELAGKQFNTTVLEEVNHEVGTVTKFWLEKENGFLVKLEVAGREIYLTDESVKKKIQTVDLENMLFAKVGKLITNVPDISYMKVKAIISSAGEKVTPESLNFPGQKFDGTVTNNLVEGIFEIEPVRYNGENAPSFPSEIKDESLQKYLEPESLIESDEPILIAEANKITNGSANSWEATVRLSKWVSEKIHGAVPGGTSAINTYNTREGECGSHSRLLTAFCRAVGIPARLSMGCMYTPYLGGSFGQHAWNEVFMGDAGWVAVDATAHELDFVDAGHIRLGETTSFNPKGMNILEYRIGSELPNNNKIPAELAEYTGKYFFEAQNTTFEILYQDGSLAVNIPGQQILALNNPDENGILYPKMTQQINLSFLRDDEGKINQMKLQQVVPLQRNSGIENKDENIPEALIPFQGKYLLTMANAVFEVFYRDEMLILKDPLANKEIRLTESSESGRWKDEFNQSEIEFEKNAEGEVVRMVIYSNVYMNKIVES